MAGRLRMNARSRIAGDTAALIVRGPGSADGLNPTSADPAYGDTACETLDGEWREVRRGALRRHRPVVSARSSPRSCRRCRQPLPAVSAAGRRWQCSSRRLRQSRVLFIDLETTGLAGGAGTYAFLVGCGWFEGATFRVRQFLLARYGAERGLLEDVAGTAGDAGALVTYNGKTFDLPLHRNAVSVSSDDRSIRGDAARRHAPCGAALVASSTIGAGESARVPEAVRFGIGSRRDRPRDRAAPRAAAVWMRWSSRSLGMCAKATCRAMSIPSRYFQYVRSGDERPLAAVLEHNRLDLLSLALLTARAAQLLDEGADAAQTAREAYGLGCLYLRAGRVTRRARVLCAGVVDGDG